MLLPVDRQAEATPQRFELLLVIDGQAFAQLHEVLATDRLLVASLNGFSATGVRGLEVGVVGQ